MKNKYVWSLLNKFKMLLKHLNEKDKIFIRKINCILQFVAYQKYLKSSFYVYSPQRCIYIDLANGYQKIAAKNQ